LASLIIVNGIIAAPDPMPRKSGTEYRGRTAEVASKNRTGV
jgi:hypothetical protein